ncbi:hypothetical protein Tco_0469332 [Tanacetum coccineum]
MDDPNITMEEYIRLEEEKAHRRGKVYNWETAKYGKIWYDEDVHNLRSVETEFPPIVLNDALTPENEFPAIVYNDALTSKLDFLIEHAVSPQHIDEFNMKDEISLSKCDEEEQNVIYFNDLFPFNVVDPDDLSYKDNDNDKIDIEHSSGDLSIEPLPNVDLAGKKSTTLVDVFIFWKSRCVEVLRDLRWLFNTFLLIYSTWRIYRAKYQGSFSF